MKIPSKERALESIVFSLIKDAVSSPILYSVVFMLYVLYEKWKGQDRILKELEAVLDKKFKAWEERQSQLEEELEKRFNHLSERHHQLDKALNERFYELDRKILQQDKKLIEHERNLVQKVDLIAFMNDTSRRFEEMNNNFLKAQREIQREFKELLKEILKAQGRSDV